MADGDAPLIEHLIELRGRLLRGLGGFFLVLLCLLPFAATLYGALAQPLTSLLPAGQSIIATDPAGAFFAPIKLAMFCALFISMPWLLYQAWAFVAPALYAREKRLALPLLASAVLLFYAGCAFSFFLVLPAVFHFLTTFGADVIAVTPDAGAYLDFVVALFFAFGLSFELPVAMVILVLLGWVTPAQLKEARGYAVVAIFVLAAIVTPPDVISQLMLAIPMCLLYEIGIHASRWLLPKPLPRDAAS